MKILLIEDSLQVAEVIFDYFKSEQYHIDYAANGLLGLKLANEHRFDCIILDIMLPGLDGITLCQQLRKAGNDSPIIMLTARDTNSDMLNGLRHGADDYIVKPFDLEVLEARMIAVMRRNNKQAFKNILTCGELVICLDTHQVWREKIKIKLNPSCFKIIKLLLQKYPKIASREEIEYELWSDQPPDKDVLRKHIYQLRNKIDKSYEFEMIKTIPKLGYLLIGSK